MMWYLPRKKSSRQAKTCLGQDLPSGRCAAVSPEARDVVTNRPVRSTTTPVVQKALPSGRRVAVSPEARVDTKVFRNGEHSPTVAPGGCLKITPAVRRRKDGKGSSPHLGKAYGTTDARYHARLKSGAVRCKAPSHRERPISVTPITLDAKPTIIDNSIKREKLSAMPLAFNLKTFKLRGILLFVVLSLVMRVATSPRPGLGLGHDKEYSNASKKKYKDVGVYDGPTRWNIQREDYVPDTWERDMVSEKIKEGYMKYYSGHIYYGGWKNFGHHGQGEMTYPNKVVYKGTWRDGEIAAGKMIFPKPCTICPAGDTWKENLPITKESKQYVENRLRRRRIKSCDDRLCKNGLRDGNIYKYKDGIIDSRRVKRRRLNDQNTSRLCRRRLTARLDRAERMMSARITKSETDV